MTDETVIKKALHSSMLSEDLYFKVITNNSLQFNYPLIADIGLKGVNFNQSGSLRERSKRTIQNHHVINITTRW